MRMLHLSLLTMLAVSPCEVRAQVEDQSNPTQSDGATLQEIIVTARKRTENLQTVPISITSVSGAQLQANNIHDMTSFAISVPNFSFSTQPAATDSYYIRGIGAAPNFGFETAVGLQIDGFYYGKTRVGSAAFLDIDQVSVLKGPQGAVLGKNNSAGAIDITTAKPTKQFSAAVSGGYNFDGDVGANVEGYVSAPITDTFSVRVAGRYDADRGYIKNLTFHDHEQRKRDGTGRLSLKWTPTPDLTINASYQRVDFRDRGNPRENYVCGPGKQAELSAPGFPSDDCKLNLVKATDGGIVPNAPTKDFYSTKLNMTHLTVEERLGPITITSLTGYMNFSSIDHFDGDNTPTPASVVITPENYKQIIQETRVFGSWNRIDLTMGLFLMHASDSAAFNFILPSFGENLDVPSNQKTTTVAPFAELTYHLTPTFDVTAGMRYTYERKSLTQSYNIRDAVSGAVISPVYSINPSRDERNISPTVDVRWHPTRDAMVYGSFRRGFRGGGFDRFLFAGNQADALSSVQFEAENVSAFELGTKLQLLDDKLRLNLALFHSKYKNLQVSSFVNSETFKVDNAASAFTKGIEAEIDWKPVRSLTLGVSGGLLSAKYARYAGAACYTAQTSAEGCIDGEQDLSGRSLAFAPKFSLAANAIYSLALGSGFNMTLFGEIRHTSGAFLSLDDNPLGFQKQYNLINARISLAHGDDRWQLSLIGRNLTNRLVRTAVNNTDPDGLDAYMLPPRTIGVQASFRY